MKSYIKEMWKDDEAVAGIVMGVATALGHIAFDHFPRWVKVFGAGGA